MKNNNIKRLQAELAKERQALKVTRWLNQKLPDYDETPFIITSRHEKYSFATVKVEGSGYPRSKEIIKQPWVVMGEVVDKLGGELASLHTGVGTFRYFIHNMDIGNAKDVKDWIACDPFKMTAMFMAHYAEKVDCHVWVETDYELFGKPMLVEVKVSCPVSSVDIKPNRKLAPHQRWGEDARYTWRPQNFGGWTTVTYGGNDGTSASFAWYRKLEVAPKEDVNNG